ncbi:MAG: four helix bundle protein [Elusimicrobia bacterium]|nr:four helix bundle protein [Elusimicrobiota bacterium]
MATFRFEKLDVWKKAMDWCEDVYRVTADFPSEERYGLVSQVRRAATSVASNIAEGSGRLSDADSNRFIAVAYGSLMEAICQLKLAMRFGYLPQGALGRLEDNAEELAKMLSGLKASRE